MELELAKQSKSTLEEEIVAKQSEIQQFHMVENQLTSQVSQLEYEILNKEKALASSEKLLEVQYSFCSPVTTYLLPVTEFQPKFTLKLMKISFFDCLRKNALKF